MSIEGSRDLICRLRVAPEMANGEGYGENAAVCLCVVWLRVLPATGEPGSSGSGMARIKCGGVNGKALAWD